MRCCRSYSARIRAMFVSVAVIGITVSTLSTFSAAMAQEGGPPAVKPGEEHALLASLAGRWAAESHFRIAPDQPATISKGTETSRMTCGGLWLVINFRGKFLGSPFEGHGTNGFDQTSGKFIGTWADSMSTGLSLSEGTYDKKTKTITYKSNSTDPQTGQNVTNTSKTIFKDENHHTLVMYMPGPDGKEFESLRIEYTRKGKKNAKGKKAVAKKPKADPLAKVAGNWDMIINYEGVGEVDYTLRVARTAAGLAGVLVSPRSGEYKFKSVAWKDDGLKMVIVRSIQGDEVELQFEGKLTDKGLSGKVTAANLDELSGAWTATKAKKKTTK